MNPSGPIIIIEADPDEVDLLRDAILQVGCTREVIALTDPIDAINSLKIQEKPFMILCNISMHGVNGFSLRKAILDDEELTWKCRPFLFYAAIGSEKDRKQVFDLGAHGYLHGINDFDVLVDTLRTAIKYWELSETIR
jgi:DNA-binding NarL/FixJ family response regulator